MPTEDTQTKTLDTLLGLTGPETELLEEITGKTFGAISAELLGDPREMSIRTAVATAFVIRRRVEPDITWDGHWALPVDESVEWLVPEEANPEA